MRAERSSPRDEDLFPEYDVDEHLAAIHSMLRHQLDWNDKHVRRIEETRAACLLLTRDTHYLREVLVEDDVNEAVKESFFADALFSNVVVGALAPLFEGIFHHEFRILELMSSVLERDPANRRTKRLIGDDEIKFFRPRVFAPRKGDELEDNIQCGSMQLLKCLKMLDRFPPTLCDVTEALFFYRNRGLHHGLEWLPETRKGFAAKLKEKPQWTPWFPPITTSSEAVPWVFCISEEFMETAFALAVETVNTFVTIQHETRMKMPPMFTPPPRAMWTEDDFETFKALDDLILSPRKYGPIRREPRPGYRQLETGTNSLENRDKTGV